MEDTDEEEAAADVDKIDEDGYPHGQLGVLHAYKPALYGIKSQRGGGGPDADEEVGEGHADDASAAVKDELGEQRDGVLQKDESQGDGEGDGDGANEDAHRLVETARTVGLCGESAGAHAKETEVPVNQVKNLGANGYGAQLRLPQVTNDGGVDHAQQRHGNVGYDVGEGKF